MASGMELKPSVGESNSNSSSSMEKLLTWGTVSPFTDIMAVLVFQRLLILKDKLVPKGLKLKSDENPICGRLTWSGPLDSLDFPNVLCRNQSQEK